MFVFDSFTDNLPISVSKYFSESRYTHDYFTRGIKDGKLVLPVFKTVKYGKHSIKYQSTAEWNKSLTEINKTFITKYGHLHQFKSILDLNRTQFKKLVCKIVFSH